MSWFNDISVKKKTVAGQVAGDEYIIALHDPAHFNYNGIYTVSFTNGTDTYQVDLDITGSTNPIFDAVSCKVVNVMATAGVGISDSLTDFNNTFDFKIVDGGANRNFVNLAFKNSAFMGGNFDMSITNKIPSGMQWTSLVDYLGKDYSSVAGYPFSNHTLLSPLSGLGGGGLTAPIITASAATSITSNSMILNGNLASLGSETSVNVFFSYRVQGSGSAYTTTTPVNKTATGAFTATITGLTPNTTYEFFATAAGQTNAGNNASSTPNLTAITTASVIDPNTIFNITGSVSNVTATALTTTTTPSISNGSIVANQVVASADNCISQTVEVAQGGGDPNWTGIKPTYQLKPIKLAIDAATTATSLVLTSPIDNLLSNGSSLWVDDGIMKEIMTLNVNKIAPTPPTTGSGIDLIAKTLTTGSLPNTQTYLRYTGTSGYYQYLSLIDNGSSKQLKLIYKSEAGSLLNTSTVYLANNPTIVAYWLYVDEAIIGNLFYDYYTDLYLLSSNGDVYAFKNMTNTITADGTVNGTFSQSPFKYICTGLTSVFGTVPLSAPPTFAAKAGQIFQSDIYTASGSATFMNDTINSVSRVGDVLTITCNQKTKSGANRYAAEKVTINNGDTMIQYSAALYE